MKNRSESSINFADFIGDLNSYEIFKTEYPSKKADLTIKEVNQHKYDGDIYVYMKITLYVRDKITDKVISAGIDIPVVFKVTDKDGQPFLADKVEYVSPNDVPQKFKWDLENGQSESRYSCGL